MKQQNAPIAGALVGLGATISQAMDENEGFVPCGHPAAVVLDGLRALGSPLDDAAYADKLEAIRGFIAHVSEHRNVPAHNGVDMNGVTGLRAQLLSILEQVARILDDKEGLHQNINVWVYRSLAAIEEGGASVDERLCEANSILAAAQQL